MEPSDKQVAVGVTGALAVCCAVHLIILAGGLGALGALLSTGLLVAAAIVSVALVAAVILLVRRRRGGCGDAPAPDHPDAESADSRESSLK